jgi:acetyl-CoA C-acetyltransferase
MGQVLQAGQGQIPSRQAQVKAGIPKDVSSETINKVCASGLRASVLLDQAIRAGDLEVGVGGGMESMSRAPYLLPEARFGYRMGDAKALDAMVHDGLTNPFSGRQMFDEATEIGDELELTRPDLDRWALRSHERAIAATDEGRLPEEIVAVTVKGRKGDTVVEVDEAPRRDSSLESLAKLPGLAGKEGSHTAGNSPGVNDGGGALVLASDEWASANGKSALAEIVAHAQSANDFAYLATTPARAAEKALAKAGLAASEIDLWEINEAFASVALNSIRMLGIDEDRVNVNGGAVALGHPRVGRADPRGAGARAAPARRRPGLRGHLQRRRPGRRRDPEGPRKRGVTHDVTPQEEVEQVPAEHGRGAAFFDLDRTLMAGSSGLYWARAARGAGLLTRRRIARYGWENVKFRLRGSTDQATDRVRREVGEMISGQRVVDLQRLAPKVLAGVLPRLYPQMLEVAHAHQDAGRPVYICTAASQEMAEMLAHVLSFDGALGARSEVVDGHYTGRPAGPFTYREGKAVAMRELAAAEGIDLGASYAYSDSESDLPMLRTVGHPVVVNPDSALRRVAREEGWEVMRFEQLGRRLKAAAAVGLAALVGTGARTVAVRGRR